MNNKKSTKRTLLTSVLSLVLCMAMLIGTTFAWFTDSVTSGNNKIKSGTLDVQLLMHDGEQYKDISDSDSPIFGEGSIAQNNNAETLWEPGKTQVAYLGIKNNGNLDLKYTVTLDVENVEKNLYEVMEYAITPNATADAPVTSWDQNAGKAVAVGMQSVSSAVALGAGDTHYFALSIHMLEEAGNDYQDGKVNFDLTVLATQLASEYDSFDNQYDANASFDLQQDEEGAYLILTATDLMAFNAWMNEAGFNGEGRGPSVKLMADIDMAGYDWLSINEMFLTFDGNGHTISNLNCIENGSKSGFFGYLGGATIKNLTLENVTSVGSQAGIFAGQSEGSKIINCNIAGTNYVAWDNDSGDTVTKNGIGAYVGVSVDAFEVSGTIEQDAEITLNTNGMTGGWDNVDKYAGGLYNAPQTIDVNDLGSITTLTYVAEGVYKNAEGTYLITNAEGIQYMSSTVSPTKGTVNDGVWMLYNDIDMTGVEWTPINNFHGTFDGNGKTISNLTVKGTNSGLFGTNENNGDGFKIPTIKNLNVTGATVEGSYAGVVIGRMAAVNIESVNVTESTVNGGSFVGGIIGHGYGPGGVKMTNCNVTACTISGSDNVGGLGGYVAYGTVTGCAVVNSTVTGSSYVGSLLGHAGNRADGLLAKVYGNTTSGNNTEQEIGYAENVQYNQ